MVAEVDKDVNVLPVVYDITGAGRIALVKPGNQENTSKFNDKQVTGYYPVCNNSLKLCKSSCIVHFKS